MSSLPFIRCLAPDGRPVGALPEWTGDRERVVALYRGMVRARVLDEKAIALQRTGRLGTYASLLGEEAVGVGLASAMRDEDVLVPSFREQAAQLWRGVTLTEILLYWGGDERGSDFKGPREDFPICVPIAAQFPQAAGVALAFRLRGERRVAVAVGGDGGTSKGDFYEAMNAAGVWSLPLVMVIANNQWAISMRRRDQTAAETLAQKAVAAGIPGEQVDGNDVIAVAEVVGRAVERARRGEGASLVEAVTYRLGDHTTSDDASRYREPAEVSPHWKEEPIGRMRAWLAAAHDWSKADEEALIRACRAEVEAATEEYLAMPTEPPVAMIDHLYASLPADLAGHRAALAAMGGDHA